MLTEFFLHCPLVYSPALRRGISLWAERVEKPVASGRERQQDEQAFFFCSIFYTAAKNIQDFDHNLHIGSM